MKKLILSLILIILFSCFLFCPSEKDISKGSESLLNDPFPTEILNHKILKIFLSDERLGYIFSDEKNEVFDRKIWDGNKNVSDTGQTKNISYSKNQIVSLKTRFANFFSFGTGIEKVNKIEIQLIGIQKIELLSPRLLPGYEKIGEYSDKNYVVSMIKVKKLLMRAYNKEGVYLEGEGSYLPLIVGAKIKYDAEYNSMMFAENAIIGYILRKPEQVEKSIGLKEAPTSVIAFTQFQNKSDNNNEIKQKVSTLFVKKGYNIITLNTKLTDVLKLTDEMQQIEYLKKQIYPKTKQVVLITSELTDRGKPKEYGGDVSCIASVTNLKILDLESKRVLKSEVYETKSFGKSDKQVLQNCVSDIGKKIEKELVIE